MHKLIRLGTKIGSIKMMASQKVHTKNLTNRDH
jgi:hypothetical protein